MEFDEFYRENYERVCRAMSLSFRDANFADEITQEAFYRALRKWSKVSKLARPDGWTMVVALNCGRDLLRRQRGHDAKSTLLTKLTPAPDEEQAIEDRMAVVDLLGSVTDRQRQVLVLRYIAQLSIPEIAQTLKCAEGTVKATLHAALRGNALRMKGNEYVDDR